MKSTSDSIYINTPFSRHENWQGSLSIKISILLWENSGKQYLIMKTNPIICYELGNNGRKAKEIQLENYGEKVT
jgi:hypothetical protein